jgi:MFS family permease
MRFKGGIKLNKKTNVYLLCFIAFFQGLVFYGPVATLYRQSRGLSMYNIFVIESIFMILMLCFEIPWGYLADRFGYKKTLIISNLLLFVSKIVFYKAYSFPMFLLERILMAVAFSGISGCDIALLYSSIDENKAEKTFGIYTSSTSIGFLLASILSSSLVVKSLDFTALATIIPFGIAALLTFFIKDIQHSNKGRISLKNNLKLAVDNKQIFIIIAAVALMAEASHTITVFLNQLQYIKSSIDIRFFGIIAALVQAAALASTKTHRLTSMFGQIKVIKILLLLISVSCFLLIYTKNPFISILLIMLVGGSFAVASPIILDIQNRSIVSSNRATMLSIYAMCSDIVSALINPVLGKTADISLEAALLGCTLLGITGFILTSIYFKKVAV